MATQLRISLRRVKNLIAYLRGDSVVITVHDRKLIVDAGSVSAPNLKEISSVFMRQAQTL